MADPAPIRGRWTITTCPHCEYGYIGPRAPRGWSCSNGHPIAEAIQVAVVPVPDEAAIERGAKAMQRAETSHSESYMRRLLDIGLRAALEAPETP